MAFAGAANSQTSGFNTPSSQHWSYVNYLDLIDIAFQNGSFSYQSVGPQIGAPIPSDTSYFSIRSPIATFVTATDQHWVYMANDGSAHVWEVVHDTATASWSATDVTAQAGAPVCANIVYELKTGEYIGGFYGNQGGITAFVDSGNNETFSYITAAGHIIRIFHQPGNGSWTWLDLTTGVRAPAVGMAGGNTNYYLGLGSFVTPYDQHWIYQGSNSHIYQIVYTPSTGVFGYMDVTAASHAPAPPLSSSSALSGFISSDGGQHFIYELKGHIYQIVFSNSGWGWMDVSAASNAPSIKASSSSSFATPYDQHWIFEDTNRNLYQIVFNQASRTWGLNNLTALAGTSNVL